jgi:small subunit ribosomal protein S3
LQGDLQAMTGRQVSIKIIEIKSPDTNAQLIGEGIAEQLKKRASFRRILKMRAEGAMQAGAKGVKILISGRLGGAEMSRTLAVSLGSIPLQTLQANVEYGFAQSFTKSGVIGVKVWIYKGPYEADAEAESTAAGGRARARGRH